MLRRIARRGPISTGLMVLVAMAGCGRKSPGPTGARAPLPAAVDSAAAAAGTTARGAGAGAAGDTTHGEPMPVLVLGGRAADSAAAAPLNLPISAIGYRNGIVLIGTTAEATVTLPVNDGLRLADLKLRMIPTPRMPPATLVLRQRDRVIALRDLTDTTTVITLPMTDVVVDQGKAVVEIGLSVPGRDRCQAELFYRTVIKPESQVTYTDAPRATAEVNGFFQPWLDRVTFYMSDRPSMDAAQAALDAAGFVARRYRGMTTIFEIKPLPPVGTPLPEPGPWSRAIIWAPTGSTRVLHIDGGRGTVLAIAARRDARQLFTLAEGADLVASAGFRSGSVDLTHNIAPNTPVRTLADLGFDSRTVDGNSLLVTSYPISLADFGTNITPTSLRLIVHHSILPVNGSGSLRVHLNGDLIYSRNLEHDGFDGVIPIPAHLLRRDNVVDVRFNVTLGEGACLVGGPTFTATIDNGSAFVTNGATAMPPGFARFPQAFVPAFSVLLEPVDRFRIELASSVIGAMQQTTRAPLAPALARDRASATGPLLAIGTGSLAEALDAPLRSDGVRLRDLNGKVWDEFAPDAPYGAMQGWVRNGDDVLLLHHTGASGQPLSELVRESFAPYGWFGVRGDLAIRGVQGPTRSLTVANAGWRIEAEPEGPQNLFLRYRNPIFGTALVLVIILSIWFAPRVVRRDLDTTG